MYYTYVLLCRDSNTNEQKFYIGYTQDINNRVLEHKQKSVETTKRFDEIELVYYEACINKTDARKREIQLKTGFGRGYINKRIESYLNTRR
jgi:putative endonuclease